MKKKMVLGLASFTLLLLTLSCTQPCEECSTTVEVTRIVEVTVTPGVSQSEAVAGSATLLEVERDNLPDNLLERINTSDEASQDLFLANELILVGPEDKLPNLISVLENEFGFKEISNSESQSNSIKLISTGIVPVDDAIEIVTDWINQNSEFEIEIGKNYLVASPWVVEASPWVVEPSGSDPIEIDIPEGEYPWNQWAFLDEYGINLYSGTGSRTITDTINGEGVRVIIYDTSPLDEQTPVSDLTFPDNIKVSFADGLLDDVESNDERYARTNEHGLFVAGLVHFVAPNAEIELVKILNDQGVGDLYTLTSELEKLLLEDDLSDVVINLSLGLHPVPLGESDNSGLLNDPAIEKLRTQMERLIVKGAVIVSAAGNHSAIFDEANSYDGMDTQDPIIIGEGPQMNSTYPGKWPLVITVSGYGGENYNRSCFTNEVPVDQLESLLGFRAPSGNGYQPDSGQSQGNRRIVFACQSPQKACEGLLATPGEYNCPYTIVSTVSDGQYLHWSGTSFGTPIVSGIVALVRQKCPESTSQGIHNFIREQYVASLDHTNHTNVFPEGKFDVAQFLSPNTGCPQ